MSDLVNVSGTPAEATPSAPPAAASAAPAAPVAAATPNATPQAPATGAPEGYVPSYRIRETREAAQREANEGFARREAEMRAETERYRQQLHAIVGVQQPNQNPEIDAIREQFSRVYPGLSKMEAQAAKLEALLTRSNDLEAQTNHYWSSYARQATDKLFSTAEKSLGSPLTDDAKQVLQGSFVSFIESSPERQSRYQNDPTIVDDFWKAFSSGFIDPARRTASAGVMNRAAASSALPQDTPSGVPNPASPPKLQNLDERAAAGWAQYNQQK